MSDHLCHIYLGDAVYGEYDGDHIILRTDSHKDSECRNKIFLNHVVLDHLVLWLEALNKKGKNNE